jgi:endonuclease/exonuclease/phosphatase family metal-dependent hydrolase
VTFRLLSYNIKRGGVGREAALADVVSACAPDLVVLQEATNPSAVERVAKAAGMIEWGSRPGLSVAFLSRRKVKGFRWKKARWARHAFLEIGLDSGEPSIFGVHLSAVHSNWTERRRLVELRALLAHVKSNGPAFHVVTGDFNTLAAGERLDLSRLPPRLRVITWMTGRRIRWQTIHLMLESAYTDAFRHLHHDAPGHTFPTWDPHLRLDYAFLPTPYADKLRDCQVVTHPAAPAASDHFPLLTDLDI